MPQKNYKTIGLISLWTSKESAKSDYNGKVQWQNNSTGEFDFQDTSRQQFVFYTKKQSQNGSDYLKGEICNKEDGNLHFDMSTALFVNQSSNQKAPVLTGTIDNKEANLKYRVSLWKNESENEKAPKFKGKIQIDADNLEF